MKLDDVLGMAGDHQLNGFEWGASAVILVNSLVGPENQIDVGHTGKQAYDKLRRLPSGTLMSVLVYEVVVEGPHVKFNGTARDQSTTVPPTVPAPTTRRMSPMAVFLMIIMSVISIALTLSSIHASRTTGSAGDTSALKLVLTTMTELVKEERTGHEADPPKEEQATPPIEPPP